MPIGDHLQHNAFEFLPIHRAQVFLYCELLLACGKSPADKIAGITEQQIRVYIDGLSYLFNLARLVLKLLDSNKHAISICSNDRGWTSKQTLGEQVSDLIRQERLALDGTDAGINPLGM